MRYQWRRNGTALTNATNTVLTLKDVHLVDVGDYDVVVANSVGSVTSDVAKLEVSFVAISRYAGLRLTGEIGSTIRIEYKENSLANEWRFLTNVVLASTQQVWIDYASPDSPMRYYRAARP